MPECGNDDRGRDSMPKLARLVALAVLIVSAATLAEAQPARYPARTIEIVVA